VPCLKALSDNYLGGSGLPLSIILTLIRQTYPITLYGVGLSLGFSLDPLKVWDLSASGVEKRP